MEQYKLPAIGLPASKTVDFHVGAGNVPTLSIAENSKQWCLPMIFVVDRALCVPIRQVSIHVVREATYKISE